MATKSRPLCDKHLAFIDYLRADPKRDQSAAYSRVYNTKKGSGSAKTGGCELMKDPRIKARIYELDQEALKAAGMTPTKLLSELNSVITADPRELMEYYRGACRYCHGYLFDYQRTPAEYRRDMEAYLLNDQARKGGPQDPLGLQFPLRGGVGFNPTLAPHPDCPECFGHGEGYTHVKDTRDLSPGAARLFAGIKQTKDGLEVKTRATDKSVELYMRHLGMLDGKSNEGSAEEKAAAVRALLGALGKTTGAP